MSLNPELTAANWGIVALASPIEVLPLLNLGQSVWGVVALFRESPLIPSPIPVRGFSDEVQNGLLTEVV